MKKNVYLLLVLLSLGSFSALNAQKIAGDCPEYYLERHPLFDYSESGLSNTASVPEYGSKPNPLKITGTVFLSDGITPAKNVILFINQADENGEYQLETTSGKRHVYHRAWIKTDADGKYTFYTFVPGKERYSKAPKSIHLFIKDPKKSQQVGYDFVFDNDPRLTKSCRKRIAKHGLDNILKPTKSDDFLVAKKDIVLEKPSIATYAQN